MDLNLAQTFLTIVYSGSFVLAAERLCVSQTAVTARIKNLEEQLQVQLFQRRSTGVSLTVQGEQFIPYAQQLLDTWQAALQALPKDNQQVPLRLAADMTLWNPWFSRWLSAFRQRHPRVYVRAEVGDSETLLDQLERGELDAVLSHHVRYRPNLQVEAVLEEKLIQVRHAQQPEPLIQVDWGGDFRQQYQLAFPGQAQAQLQVNVGQLALQLLLEQGGTGYFRSQVVLPYLQSGQLLRNDKAPEFIWPLYVVSRLHNGHPQLEHALVCLVQAEQLNPAG